LVFDCLYVLLYTVQYRSITKLKMDVDSNIPHVSDSSSKSPSPEARLPPVLQYIQDWTPRMAAALAALPDREDVSRRDKFVSGMEWEFVCFPAFSL